MLARSMAWRHGESHLCERDVDHQDLLVSDEEVGELDVAVCKPGVPEGARIKVSPLSMTSSSISSSESPISLAPSKNSRRAGTRAPAWARRCRRGRR